MRSIRLPALIALVLSACAVPSEHGEEVAVTTAALLWQDGTRTVDVQADVEAPRCDGAQGLMGVTGTFTANAPVTIALVATTTTMGGAEQVIEVVTPDVFTQSGSDWVASFGTDVNVPDGVHRIEICFGIVTSRGLSTVRGCIGEFQTNIHCSGPPPDMTPPTIVGSRAPAANANGWNNTDVTASFMCSDADSGVASCTAPVTLSGEGAGQSVMGTAVDNAGNMASTVVGDINIDKTAPSISADRSVAPNAAGWNNEAVTVSFTCSDALSGVVSCADPVVLSSEGAGQAASGAATDAADNSAMVTEDPVNIDLTAPVVVFDGDREYTEDEVVSITCTASDALSGIASSSCADVTGDASSFGVGTHMIEATVTDNAGNTTSVTDSFTVTAVEPPVVDLCDLIKSYASKASLAKVGCLLVKSIEHEIDRGRTLLARIKVLVFVIWVRAMEHLRVFTHAEADHLVDLARDMVD